MSNPHFGHSAEGQQELHSEIPQPTRPLGPMQNSISLSGSQVYREQTVQLHLKQL